jgi:hypothetical protein
MAELHAPEWHLLDSEFGQANEGLDVPVRRTTAGSASLRIENLDRADPPGYTAGGVPRGEFNANVYRLSSRPAMPQIPVTCKVAGFEPSSTPVRWRLICRHVLGRHVNAGGFRYQSACEIYEREWHGESRAAQFTLFGTPEVCSCTYNDDTRVLGGHALLMVAASTPSGPLIDYVHVRIGGTNPTQADVYRYLDHQLEGFDRNIVRMVRAVFQHESSFTQFAAGPQTASAMTFAKNHHRNASQNDCRVRFDWPNDPPHFPLASFDFGVGISQFTRVGNQRVPAEIAWDWRENVRLGTNLLLDKLRRRFEQGMTWQRWALAGWKAYNGAGAAAERYAKKLADSLEGREISMDPVRIAPSIDLLAPPPVLAPPGPWVSV